MTQFFYMVAYDIRFSFRKNRAKWLAALVIQVYLCIRIFGELSFYDTSYDVFSALWTMMRGDEFLEPTLKGAYWVLFHGYLFFLIGFYPVNELYLGNGQTCIRAHSRKRWLMSKLVSVVVNVIVYYGCFVAIIVYGSCLHGGTLLPESGILASDIPIFNLTMTELWLHFLILPCLVSLAVGELQVILSLWINPVFAFMITIGYIIASIFLIHPYILGNFAMLYRQEWISGIAEMDTVRGIQICIVLMVVTIVSGLFLFEKKDILPDE